MESRAARILIKAGSVLALVFLYVPLAIVVLYAFNNSIGQRWPITSFTTKYFGLAWRNPLVREALITSLEVAAAATVLALLLGGMAAFAVHRFNFFGRNSISFVLVLPIALPGIVTGIALNATFNEVLVPIGIQFGLFTIIVGHATFCIVVVYNNVLARLRRTSRSLEEASADLGADTWQTFRYVLLPQLGTAILAGALLAFALSFDEVIVTTFTAGNQQTLPLWIFANISRPNQLPIINVVALFVIVVSIIPVYLAQRLTEEPRGVGGRAPAVPEP